MRSSFGTLLFGLFILAALPDAYSAAIISPSGAAYGSVSASGQFSASFPPANLFNTDVTDLPLGAATGSSSDWAIVGSGPAYVEFQLDQSYEVGSLFYAQRVGANPSLDKVTQISLWASATTPFSPADPGTLPHRIITITNQQSGIWCEYSIPAPVSGRYFLLRMEQTPIAGGNIGGNELRLGRAAPDTAPPTLTFLYPSPNSVLRRLTAVEVGFSEPVAGVDAADLLVNGLPATKVTGVTPSQFVFSVAPLPDGPVQLVWAGNHGIRDQSSNSNAFAGGSWSYTLDSTLPAGADVILSEFLASNGGDQTNSLHDELGKSPDWIELYNATDGPVDLTGWFLTDDPGKPAKWAFPPVLMPEQSYLVVFASGRDTNVAGQLHAGFKLSAGGGYLALLDPSTNLVSGFPAYPQQYTDVSYGRERSDSTLTGFFSVTTPGAPNSDRGLGFAPAVQFSRSSGTFIDSFFLWLTTPDPDCEIHYVWVRTNTAPGSPAVTNLPTLASPKYNGPLIVDQTMQVRAKAFPKQPGVFPGPPVTECFVKITPQAAAFNSDLPIILVDNLSGGMVPASIDQLAIVMVFEPFQGRCSLTNPPTLVTRAGLNVRGRSTAAFPKSSFALETWDEYNGDRDVRFCGLPEESDWVLYAPNCFDIPLLHNPLMHQLSRDLGRYSSRTRFAELFLNTGGTAVHFSAPAGGNYHGVYVVEEKVKRDDNRVDIDSLTPQITTLPGISGGYLFKVDEADADEVGFTAGGLGGGGSRMLYQEPSGPEMVSPLRFAQNQYFTNYLTSFFNTLYGPGWLDPVAGYAQYFDVAAGIDHHLLNVLALNVDAFRLSAYMHIPRSGRITMGPLWDFDRSLGTSRGDTRPFNPRLWRGIDYDLSTDFFNPSAYFNNAWYHRLFNDPDFWQRYIDRYQELRASLWTTNRLFEVIDTLAGQVRAAQPREVARWAGSGSSDTSPRSGQVTANGYSYDFGSFGSYQGEINFLKRWLSDRLHFMDTNFLQRPIFNHPGGQVTNGFVLTVAGPAKAGTLIYFTVDGTDPRLPGGGIAPGARVYAGPVTLTNNARVVARAYNQNHQNLTGPHNPPLSSPWSGLAAATYVLNSPSLAITEIMFHPLPPTAGTNDSNDFEFLELRNVGSHPLSLVGTRFTRGIEFTFTAADPITTLAPGQYLVLVSDRSAFLSRYPTVTNIAGQYTGHLDSTGERIALEGPLQEPICDFTFVDDWYPTTDGHGFSLVIQNDNAAPGTYADPANWRASAASGGSPGKTDPLPFIPRILVNEALTHTDPPQVDAVELFNPGASAVPICGWFLTDDSENPFKYRIPTNTVVPAGGCITLGDLPFALSSLGEEVYLFSGDGTNLTGYRHGFEFGAQVNGVTFGRYVTSTGEEHFVAQRSNSLGSANIGARVGPVIISEIMFNPPPYGVNNNPFDEFIELRNITAEAVPLFDPAHSTNTWRLDGGVEYVFPSGTVCPPLASVLVVNFDPAHDPARLAWFRNLYSVSPTVPVFGPWSGNLDNAGEATRLYRPDAPQLPPAADAGFVPQVLVEEVRYAPVSPWPAGADGTGQSLQRLANIEYGDDPVNWQAASPTPGFLNAATLAADTDQDGLPDEWEIAHGLDPRDSGDLNGPNGDLDADGMNNLEEFRAGTNPLDARSRLEIATAVLNAEVVLTFQAVSDRAYTVEYADFLGEPWQSLADVAPRSTNHTATLTDAPLRAQRFYRLLTTKPLN